MFWLFFKDFLSKEDYEFEDSEYLCICSFRFLKFNFNSVNINFYKYIDFIYLQ